ncbi:hypothetical protein QN357_01535 [Cryobacterium sp. RTC2.1]|uniref:hypothetical protein n=1 Tax=Cryobacterium sp. RTC2.1 TaxID=3048634 RepID=UPI002B23704E|nr:hypothetical protein [Cryobacterium sp. RTC2.1]MEB0001618.1 hypothetical protein [Cryobacterium sp. RTC2.1]
MSKTHYSPTAVQEARIWSVLSAVAPLHGTAYAGGINGIEVSNNPDHVDCKVCLKKMDGRMFVEAPRDGLAELGVVA